MNELSKYFKDLAKQALEYAGQKYVEDGMPNWDSYSSTYNSNFETKFSELISSVFFETDADIEDNSEEISETVKAKFAFHS